MKNLLKTTAKALAALACLAPLAAQTRPDGELVKPSKHIEAPDTSSAIATKAQETREGLTSIEVVRLMGNGVNLGNTMEACGKAVPCKEPTLYEKLWGQPVTTEAMIKGYKAAGFDSLRIPVAWVTNGSFYYEGDYTISAKLLDRIETITRYALDAGLYVVINDHWDGGWWGLFGSEKMSTREDAMELYTKMWTQIATRFKNYSDRVIFEGGNEEIGSRLNDVNVAIDGGKLSEDECYAYANLINQKFVDTVRATGGNNSVRFLLIPGFNTDIAKTCDERFKMPGDSAKNRLLLSVHYYTPWTFCGDQISQSRWGTKKDLEEQNANMERMKKFTDAGYGVVIGEFQAGSKWDKGKAEILPDALPFFNNLLDNCDAYDYCPMLWETGAFYNKKDAAMRDKGIAKMYLKRAQKKEKSVEKVKASALKSIAARLKKAPDTFSKTAQKVEGKPIAWLMFNSADWGKTYSSGDKYNPDSISDGMKATDVEIKGNGTYTVALDFSKTSVDGKGTARGTAFCAVGLANGETLFPGCVIDIKEIKVDGRPFPLTAKPYTTSDDGKCARVNIYNEWVTAVPDGARTADGSAEGVSAVVIDRTRLEKFTTIEVTFDFIAKE